MGARVAGVADAVTDGGAVLSLVPSSELLSGPGVTYPVYVDPDFSFNTKDGSRMHFDDVQSSCAGVSHYDDSSYWSLGMGYQADGCEGNSGYADAYYEVWVQASGRTPAPGSARENSTYRNQTGNGLPELTGGSRLSAKPAGPISRSLLMTRLSLSAKIP